jgi:hypothetical protein
MVGTDPEISTTVGSVPIGSGFTAPAASTLNSAEPTLSMAIFHNYGPRIAPSKSEGPDRVLGKIGIDGDAWILNVPYELRPLCE